MISNGYGRLLLNENGEMEDENGTLIQGLDAPPTNPAARNGKQLKDDKKSKDKNQRKR